LEHVDGPFQFTYNGGSKTMMLNTDNEIRDVMKKETGAEEVLLFRNHKVVL
jgi:hypothetical protein